MPRSDEPLVLLLLRFVAYFVTIGVRWLANLLYLPLHLFQIFILTSLESMYLKWSFSKQWYSTPIRYLMITFYYPIQTAYLYTVLYPIYYYSIYMSHQSFLVSVLIVSLCFVTFFALEAFATVKRYFNPEITIRMSRIFLQAQYEFYLFSLFVATIVLHFRKTTLLQQFSNFLQSEKTKKQEFSLPLQTISEWIPSLFFLSILDWITIPMYGWLTFVVSWRVPKEQNEWNHFLIWKEALHGSFDLIVFLIAFPILFFSSHWNEFYNSFVNASGQEKSSVCAEYLEKWISDIPYYLCTLLIYITLYRIKEMKQEFATQKQEWKRIVSLQVKLILSEIPYYVSVVLVKWIFQYRNYEISSVEEESINLKQQLLQRRRLFSVMAEHIIDILYCGYSIPIFITVYRIRYLLRLVDKESNVLKKRKALQEAFFEWCDDSIYALYSMCSLWRVTPIFYSFFDSTYTSITRKQLIYQQFVLLCNDIVYVYSYFVLVCSITGIKILLQNSDRFFVIELVTTYSVACYQSMKLFWLLLFTCPWRAFICGYQLLYKTEMDPLQTKEDALFIFKQVNARVSNQIYCGILLDIPTFLCYGLISISWKRSELCSFDSLFVLSKQYKKCTASHKEVMKLMIPLTKEFVLWMLELCIKMLSINWRSQFLKQEHHLTFTMQCKWYCKLIGYCVLDWFCVPIVLLLFCSWYHNSIKSILQTKPIAYDINWSILQLYKEYVLDWLHIGLLPCLLWRLPFVLRKLSSVKEKRYFIRHECKETLIDIPFFFMLLFLLITIYRVRFIKWNIVTFRQQMSNLTRSSAKESPVILTCLLLSMTITPWHLYTIWSILFYTQYESDIYPKCKQCLKSILDDLLCMSCALIMPIIMPWRAVYLLYFIFRTKSHNELTSKVYPLPSKRKALQLQTWNGLKDWFRIVETIVSFALFLPLVRVVFHYLTHSQLTSQNKVIDTSFLRNTVQPNNGMILPAELMYSVFEYSKDKELWHVIPLVCQEWKLMSDNEEWIWKQRYQKVSHKMKPPLNGYKKAYKQFVLQQYKPKPMKLTFFQMIHVQLKDYFSKEAIYILFLPWQWFGAVICFPFLYALSSVYQSRNGRREDVILLLFDSPQFLVLFALYTIVELLINAGKQVYMKVFSFLIACALAFSKQKPKIKELYWKDVIPDLIHIIGGICIETARIAVLFSLPWATMIRIHFSVALQSLFTEIEYFGSLLPLFSSLPLVIKIIFAPHYLLSNCYLFLFSFASPLIHYSLKDSYLNMVLFHLIYYAIMRYYIREMTFYIRAKYPHFEPFYLLGVYLKFIFVKVVRIVDRTVVQPVKWICVEWIWKWLIYEWGSRLLLLNGKVLATVTKYSYKLGRVGDAFILTPFAIVWVSWPLLIQYFILYENRAFWVPAVIISVASLLRSIQVIKANWK